MTSTPQQAAGTLVGAQVGNSIGGLIGGLNDGPRGEFFGSAIGTIAGAVVGNVLNAPEREARAAASSQQKMETGRGAGSNIPYLSGRYPQLEVRNVMFTELSGDGCLQPRETGSISFEIVNMGDYTFYDIYPMVTLKGVKNITLSPSVKIEQLRPNEGIRYSTAVGAGKRIKTATAVVQIDLIIDNAPLRAETLYFPTCKN